MTLRRCPACKNMVDWESEICPMCGRTHAQIIARQIFRWAVILLLVGVISYEIVHRHRYVRSNHAYYDDSPAPSSRAVC